MKDYSSDSQGRSSTQLWWSEPMLKDAIKVDKKDVVQDVAGMLEIELQRKDV